MLKLETGDTLLMYTDGVTEAFNEEREQFSENRLQNALKNLPENPQTKDVVTEILRQVKNFSGNYPQSDDITLLSLQRTE